jgi:pimeloyl-ACP methyl ester carboxylesterase
MERFESAARLAVRGLRNRYRRAGLGAPMTAGLGAPEPSVPRASWSRRIPAVLRVSATAVLRLDRPRAHLGAGRLGGRLEVYTPDDAATVSIDGRPEPLEFETTAALAQSFDDVPVWDLEVKGFLGASLPYREDRARDGLLLMGPYRPGRIPLVLVHGTLSSPIRWGELINELQNDPQLGQAYQVWLFVYNTGNPTPYSAGLLREALEATVETLDPDRHDLALHRLVVIGHSQGGLLAKLVAVDTGTRLWDRLSDVPLDTVDVDPAVRELLRRSLVFTPLPFVERVVFLATPHRGSALTLRPIRRMVRNIIRLPARLGEGMTLLLERPELRRVRWLLEGLPSSLDSMRPENPALQELAALPVAPGITAHSIIAVRGDGPPAAGGDGAVRYTSAHLDGVASEKVVRSGHSLQAHPETIEEIRRILREHLAPTPR